MTDNLSPLFCLLVARVGRKRGKMNLEKSINKNMFNMSAAIHNANPIVPSNRPKVDPCDQADSPGCASKIANPKQKLTSQFRRAITAIRQRSDPSSDSPPIISSTPPRVSTMEKLIEPAGLTSLIEEPSKINDTSGHLSTSSTLTPKSQSFVQLKSPPSRSASNQLLDNNNSTTTTVLNIDPPNLRSTHPKTPSTRLVKQSLQQIHSSILQTMTQRHPLSPTTTATSSSSATLSPTPTSSSTTGTGEVAILETIL